MRSRKISLIIVLLFLIVVTSINVVNAENGVSYYTFVVDSNMDLIPTQDAYIGVKNIGTIAVQNSETDGFNVPEDIYYQEDRQEFYIADTGNSRVLVTNPEFRTAISVGEGVLNQPQGVYANSDGTIYVADYGAKAIFVFTLNQGSYTYQMIGKPNHPLYGESVEFKPTKITVDSIGTMYVIDAGNANGVVQITADGSFSGYFGANYTTPDLSYIIRFLFSTKEQRAQLYRSPIAPTNLTFDYDGLLVTVTAGIEETALKKLNIAGNNMFTDHMYYSNSYVDVCIGPTGTIYCVNSEGNILEFDKEGNLLFGFGGKDTSSMYIGLFADPKAIEVDSNYQLYVLDKSSIQVFIPTEFSEYVHQALELYSDGKYAQSREPWEKVLAMNNMFDLAHVGLGNAYLRETNYQAALEEFRVAKDVSGYSQAYWELRNDWLMDYAGIIIVILFTVIVVFYILNKVKVLEKPKHALSEVKNKIMSVSFINQMAFMFTFIRHPLNGFYAIQKEKKMGALAATVWYIIFFIIILLSNILVGFVFNTTDVEVISLLQIFSTSMLPILLFVFVNHLISSITDGSGTLKEAYVGTICSFAPIICFYPIIILISNFLTLNEEFIYTMPTICLWGWSFILLYFMIKDIQNLQVGENNKNILLTVVTMILFVAFGFLLYILGSQLYDFIREIILEVLGNA